jgi:hypothetical protein
MSRASIAAALSVAAMLVLAPAASAIDKVNTQKLRKGVTLEGILEHERALQRIAVTHDGNRAAMTLPSTTWRAGCATRATASAWTSSTSPSGR